MTDLNVPGARSPVFEFYADAETTKETDETFGVAVKYIDIPKSELYERLQIRPPKDGEDVIGPSDNLESAKDNAEFSACPSCGKTHKFTMHRDPLDDLCGRSMEPESTAGRS